MDYDYDKSEDKSGVFTPNFQNDASAESRKYHPVEYFGKDKDKELGD